MATVPIFVMPHDKTSLAKSIFEQYLFFSFVIFCIINYFLVFFSDWCWVFFKFALIYWTMICESILVDIMGLSKSVKRENKFSDACLQQIFGFADFFFWFFISLFHLLLTTHNPMAYVARDTTITWYSNKIGLANECALLSVWECVIVMKVC